MDTAPQISVVIATYNSAKTLEECLDSIVGQTCADKEIIIIDGGSSDGTVAILSAYSQHLAYTISEPDEGVYDAWNKGVAVARGHWICFIGSDDYLADCNVFSDVLPRLQRAELGGTQWVYGKVAIISDRTNTVIALENVPWVVARSGFFKCMNIFHAGSFHHREMFRVHGLFDKSFKITGDYEMILRSVLHDAPDFINRVVLNMRRGGLTSNVRTVQPALREILRGRKKNRVPGLALGLHFRLAIFPVFNVLHRAFGEDFGRMLADTWRVVTGKHRLWTR